MKTISLFIAAVILFIGISAAADEIRLTNGDILTGEIIVMEGDIALVWEDGEKLFNL